MTAATNSDGDAPMPTLNKGQYDALGRRIAKTVNGVTTRYVLDSSNVRLELDSGNQVIAANTESGLDQLLVRDSSTGTYFVHTDGLGSTTALTDSSGNVVERYRYSSFGQLQVLNPDFTPKAGNVPVIPETYTGREWDADAGLYFYRARFYSPGMGRFLSQDPLGYAAGLNYYSYVGNNSINLTDPLGHDWRPPAFDPNDPERSLYVMDAYAGKVHPDLSEDPDSAVAYMNGQATRTEAQAAKDIDLAALWVSTLPVSAPSSAGDAAAITLKTLVTASITGATVNAAASGVVAKANDEPVAPAVIGGAVTGAITGPLGTLSGTFDPAMGWLTNSISGFAGNYAGNTASQFYANGGSNNYSSDQAFQSGLWGAAVNHGENTASEGTSYLLPAGNPLVKSAVDFGVSAADSAASERIMTGNSNSDPSQGGYH